MTRDQKAVQRSAAKRSEEERTPFLTLPFPPPLSTPLPYLEGTAPSSEGRPARSHRRDATRRSGRGRGAGRAEAKRSTRFLLP